MTQFPEFGDEVRSPDVATTGGMRWGQVPKGASWGGSYGSETSAERKDASPSSWNARFARSKFRGQIGARRWAALAAALLLAGASGGGVGYVIGTTTTASSSLAMPVARVLPASPATQQINVAAIAKAVDPAVVDINSTAVETQAPSFFGFGGPTEAALAGTGMIVSPNGLVLTNNHVIENAISIKVSIYGHKGAYPATVVGVDPSQDIALIHVEGVSGLPTVHFSSSPAVLGEPVAAIGNALGLGGAPTVTTGTISALNRSITASGEFDVSENLSGLLQTDAPIEPGNSGGPLVDAEGQVLGMVTAAATGAQSTTTASGVGFAIPVAQARKIMAEILSGRPYPGIYRGEQAFLGVEVTTMTPSLAPEVGLMTPNGALVLSVVPGTAAYRAGLAPGDDIIALGGRPVANQPELASYLAKYRPGQAVTIVWIDPEGRHAARVALGMYPVR